MKTRAALRLRSSTLLEGGALILFSCGVFTPTKAEQWVVATAVAGVVAIAVGMLREVMGSATHVRSSWLPLLSARILPALAFDLCRLRGAATVAAIAARGRRGRCRRVRCLAGADTPVGRGRRATILVAASVAPNTIALEIARKEENLVIHQLVPAPVPEDPEWPL